MVKRAFDTALFAGKTWFWREMYKSLTHNISLDGRPDLMQQRFNRALDLAELVIDKCPELGVQFAGTLYSRDWHSYARPRAAGLIWHNAEAAWAVNPVATRQVLESAALASRDDGYHNAFIKKLYQLAPELEPGPWGSRGHGTPADWVRG